MTTTKTTPEAEIFILTLRYRINFRDSDDGNCHAGDGSHNVAAYRDRDAAQVIADTWNPVIAQAAACRIVFPAQKHDRAVKKRFGFSVHDFDDGYDFRLEVVPCSLI